MKHREVKVTRNYSFWKHPIKWFKDIKKIALMDLYVNQQWENGMREEIQQMQMDIFTHGTAVMKDGKRVNPNKFKS